MKNRIFLSFIVALSLAALGFASTPTDSTKSQKPKKTVTAKSKGMTVYICPMDKGVVSAKPGNCPKCGMTLQKKIIPATTVKNKIVTGGKQ
jgi:predicted lipoprotein with Yx(FWY)xxD motif